MVWASGLVSWGVWVLGVFRVLGSRAFGALMVSG